MLNLKKLKDSKFSLLESVKIYKDMFFELLAPILKTSLLAMVFIFLGQTVLSLTESSKIVNICFWVWVGFVFAIVMASFFKTSEDIVLNKTAQIYANISYVLVVAFKLLAVIGIIVGAVILLLLPAYYLKNPLFSLPYKALATIFLIAALPFICFAPLAVVLREANILNSFVFSYYMVLARWGKVAKAMVVQIIFTVIIAFWAYFIVSLLFFPNSSDFFNFVFTHATALEMQSRPLYVRFICWEILQVFIFTMVMAIFTSSNTILFLYLEGTIAKLVKANKKVKVNRSKSGKDGKVNFVDVLENTKTIEIDTKPKETKDDNDTDDGYQSYQDEQEQENKEDVVILDNEDDMK